MSMISVFIAAAAAYGFGAIWYMALSRPWVAAAGIPCDASGKPLNQGATPFIIAAVAVLLVAGMMRHVFVMSGIEGLAAGMLSGFGFGAFIVLPWIVVNYAYARRPAALTVIDGGYATIGCSIIGAVLMLF